LLSEKNDNKTTENFVHQFKFAPNYLDRKEALDYFSKKGMKELLLGLNDKYAGIRKYTLTRLGSSKMVKENEVLEKIEALAKNEKDKKTKAAALMILVKTKDDKYLPLFESCVSDSSYSVAGAALEGIVQSNPVKAYEFAKKFSNDAKGALGNIVIRTLFSNGTEADFDIIAKSYNEMPASREKIMGTENFCGYLEKLNDINRIKKGIDNIFKFRDQIPEEYRSFIDPSFKKALDKISKTKGAEIEDYIKKGFE
jgi:aminopeptidase N